MTRATVTNLTRQCPLATDALVPETPEERRNGLLGFDSLEPGQGLVLLDCSAIHTVGMQFPIDVVFCDGPGWVKFAATIKPENRHCSVNGAKFVVELPAGVLRATRTMIGDRIQVTALR